MDRPDFVPASRDEEFLRLFLQHERRIFSFILGLVPNWNDAEDMLQDTATTLWEKYDDFETGTNFHAWALTVARYKVLEYRKKKRRDLIFEDGLFETISDSLATQAEKSELRFDALRQCLSNLDAKDRELIRLRYRPDATTRSVAEGVGRTTNAVYKTLNRVHRQLLLCVRNSLAREAGAN
ncbi:MAG: sigma-70 family RNA polymerase sigma factor [Planctomycetota bacterium]